MVYVGANDGMLHAFNSGYFDPNTKKFWRNLTGSTYSDTGLPLGRELWAYVPRELLPHLKWLTDPDYSHVYYVDMTPKVVDARIFDSERDNPNGTHPYGWGTILIGGMRFGGKEICTEGDQYFYSAYFAIDITNPDNPSYLWSFVLPNQTLTVSRPGVMRMLTQDNNGNTVDKWYMVVGSGPVDYDGYSNITTLTSGQLYVVDLKTGQLMRTFSTGDAEAFFADVTTVDVALDNKTDVAYVGETYYTNGQGYRGKMYRLITKNDYDVSNWTLSVLYPSTEPITSAPTVALDKRGNLWTFFGTGMFYGTLDKDPNGSGSFFGIKDGARPWLAPYTNTSSYTNLLDVSNAIVYYGGGDVTVPGQSNITNWAELINEIYQRDGWFIDFDTITDTTDFLGNEVSHQGERVIAKPLVIGGLVLWTTYIPGIDQCTYEGTSNIYGVYYETGTSYYKYVFREEEKLKQGAQTPQTVSKMMKLGHGMPSTIGGKVTSGGKLKGYVQQSTGAVLQIETETPFNVKSGVAGWKEDNL